MADPVGSRTTAAPRSWAAVVSINIGASPRLSSLQRKRYGRSVRRPYGATERVPVLRSIVRRHPLVDDRHDARHPFEPRLREQVARHPSYGAWIHIQALLNRGNKLLMVF